ncbi:hypothetical protein GCM10007028_13590 [Algibacter mikhailovii]|uniref:Uncharacterized protein n=1 Tax=Algibacter mikhailovii TaxID=425498 RepID=A0A918QZQ9_9FLAO|nr:hypothetical protein GCM10007028_13590 [Algibacter mikhailovii]
MMHEPFYLFPILIFNNYSFVTVCFSVTLIIPFEMIEKGTFNVYNLLFVGLHEMCYE